MNAYLEISFPLIQSIVFSQRELVRESLNNDIKIEERVILLFSIVFV